MITYGKLVLCFLSLLSLLASIDSYSQPYDSTSFSINSRYTFYTYEKDGEFLLGIPPKLMQHTLNVTVAAGERIIGSWKGKAGKSIVKVPFTIDLKPGAYLITAKISTEIQSFSSYLATCQLLILSNKPNEVKADRLTGGIIVNRRQFFPFGFYCYSPVSSTLPEEEAVKGFNMISPYQAILPETLNERKAYMDRCAEVGMKVHYNLISLSGGGGVVSGGGNERC